MYRRREYLAGGSIEIIDDAYFTEFGFTYRTQMFVDGRAYSDHYRTVPAEDAPTFDELMSNGYDIEPHM